MEWLTAQFICLVAGPIITLLVSAFKGWSVVKNHAKWWALGFSVLVPLVSELTFGGLDWAELATCIIVPFSIAVAGYEVQKSASKALRKES